MFRSARVALALAVSALFAGPAFAEPGFTVTAPGAAPVIAAPVAPAGIVPPPPVPAVDVTSAPVPLPAAPAPPAPIPSLAPVPAPLPERPSAGIVRSGTPEEGCFAGKDEYLDVWHATGVAPDPCFVPPAVNGQAQPGGVTGTLDGVPFPA